MTTNSIQVIPTQGVYVVSDGGRIAKHLGIKKPIPWQIVASTVDELPSSITTLETMISSIIPSGSTRTRTPRKKRARKKAAVKKTVVKTKSRTTRKKAAKKTAKKAKATKKATKRQVTAKKGSIRELVGDKLLGAHVARLEKAGITTVKALTKKKREQVLAIPGVGEKMVVTLEKCLKKAGHSFAS